MRSNQLDLASLILQLYNLVLLMQDFNNTDLMQELQKQDTCYFEKILKNQEKIIHLLEKGGTTDGEINRKN